VLLRPISYRLTLYYATTDLVSVGRSLAARNGAFLPLNVSIVLRHHGACPRGAMIGSYGPCVRGAIIGSYSGDCPRAAMIGSYGPCVRGAIIGR
jgi:hypothetical protein